MGNNSNDDANMAGMTPAGFTFTGRLEFSPSNIFIPTCLLGYCRGTLRRALSTKTTNELNTIRRKIRGIGYIKSDQESQLKQERLFAIDKELALFSIAVACSSEYCIDRRTGISGSNLTLAAKNDTCKL